MIATPASCCASAAPVSMRRSALRDLEAGRRLDRAGADAGVTDAVGELAHVELGDLLRVAGPPVVRDPHRLVLGVEAGGAHDVHARPLGDLRVELRVAAELDGARVDEGAEAGVEQLGHLVDRVVDRLDARSHEYVGSSSSPVHEMRMCSCTSVRPRSAASTGPVTVWTTPIATPRGRRAWFRELRREYTTARRLAASPSRSRDVSGAGCRAPRGRGVCNRFATRSRSGQSTRALNATPKSLLRRVVQQVMPHS